MNILDNIKSLLFCFHTSDVRRTIYDLYSENQPGSGALVFTGNIWHQKYKSKKEGVKNYLRYSSNRLFKISLSLRYRAGSGIRPKPDPRPWPKGQKLVRPGKGDRLMVAVLRIRFILIWNRSGSSDPFRGKTDPDPTWKKKYFL